ncbi:MAG: AAA family ATPase [Acidimicrobiia bacterium]|nr:AAA family ATPase [Acidimicrobiia bacterium]
MTVLSPTYTVDSDWDDIVTSSGGTELILAGPGTGKSEFLVQRAVYLLGESQISPDQLLVMTFSRRAAADLRSRILSGLEGTISDVTATTFHAFASGLLDRHGDHLTEGISYRPMTGPEQQETVHELLESEDPDNWPLTLRGILSSPTLAAEVTDFLTRCRERLLDPPDIEVLAEQHREWRALPNFMRRYDAHLEEKELLDYGLLIRRAIDLLERRPHLVESVTTVFVDEYQDTSPAQVLLLEKVVAGTKDLTVTADPAQSIYAFRGADPSNVAEFPERFGSPLSPVVVRNLVKSLRVPASILAGAQRVLGEGVAAAPVEPADHEGILDIFVFDQETAEADWIAAELERHHRLERIPYSQMAVLTRSSRGFGSGLAWALEGRGIPHDGEDGRLVDHPGVRLITDLVRVTEILSKPGSPGARAELEELLRRIVLGPLVGATVGAERELARARHVQDDPGTGPLTGVETLDAIIRNPDWAMSELAADGFWRLWCDLPGLEKLISHPDYLEHRRAWAQLGHTLERARERDSKATLADILTAATPEDFDASVRLTHQRPRLDVVTTTTLHQAKGLEFDVVIIANALEGVFPDPSGRSRPLLRPELLDGNPDADFRRSRLGEERRLAYMGTTRARRRAVWTATVAGIDEADRRPSRFLLEVADVDELSELSSPNRPRSPLFTPISKREAGVDLRRRVLDPSTPNVERLAAGTLLTEKWDVSQIPGVPAPGPDDGIIGDHPTISPSQAQRYLDCPRRYVLERRLGVSGGDLRYARFGQHVHSILEVVEGRARAEGRPHANLEEAIFTAEEEFSNADFGTPVLNRAWLRQAIELLTTLYTDWPGGKDRPPLELEHDVEVDIAGVTWKGRIDRIEDRNGTIVVIDYKTSKSLAIGETEASLQLGFYILAVESDPRFSGDVEAEIWAPRRRSQPIRYDRKHLDETTDLLGRAVSGIMSEDWTPRPSGDCQRCPVRNSCPVWPEGRGPFL